MKRLILLEGPDGCGKTTVSGLLANHLTALGETVKETGTPTTGPVGTLIREFLEMKHQLPQDDLSLQRLMAQLYMADMEWYYNHFLKHSEFDNAWIIQSRGIYSTMIYQPDMVRALNMLEARERFPKPDLLIFLTVDVETALKRVSGKKPDIYERRENLERVCRDYAIDAQHYAASRRMPNQERAVSIDGTMDQARVFEYVLKAIADAGLLKDLSLGVPEQ